MTGITPPNGYSIASKALLEDEKVVFLLPSNSGPVVYEHYLDPTEGIRIFAMTDEYARPSVGVARICTTDGTPPGGFMCFQHDSCLMQKDILIGSLNYTTEVKLNWSGIEIKIYTRMPKNNTKKEVLTHQLPWR